MKNAHAPITITDQDLDRLSDVVSAFGERNLDAADSLATELERARVVPAASIAPTVVTMNSRVVCRNERDELHELTLVYPQRAHADSGRISVLAPLGIALLGASVGDTVQSAVGAGRPRAWRIESIAYQPESAGDYHL